MQRPGSTAGSGSASDQRPTRAPRTEGPARGQARGGLLGLHGALSPGWDTLTAFLGRAGILLCFEDPPSCLAQMCPDTWRVCQLLLSLPRQEWELKNGT